MLLSVARLNAERWHRWHHLALDSHMAGIDDKAHYRDDQQPGDSSGNKILPEHLCPQTCIQEKEEARADMTVSADSAPQQWR